RDQGRVLRSDRRVLDRLADEVATGRSGARERRRDARRRRRLRGSLRPGISVPQPEDAPRPGPLSHGRIHGSRRLKRGQRGYGILLRAVPEERPQPPHLDHSRPAAHRDGHLDRTDLPPASAAGTPWPFDAHRVRDHHEHGRRTGGVTKNCHLSVQQTHHYSYSGWSPSKGCEILLVRSALRASPAVYRSLSLEALGERG